MFSFFHKKSKRKGSSPYDEQIAELNKQLDSLNKRLAHSQRLSKTSSRNGDSSARGSRHSSRAQMRSTKQRANTLEPPEAVEAMRLRRKYVVMGGPASNTVRRKMHEGLLLMGILAVAIIGSLTWLLSVLNEG